MKQIIKAVFLILVIGGILSCDHSDIKKENERLKQENKCIEVENTNYRHKEQQELYARMNTKYAVVSYKISRCTSSSRSGNDNWKCVRWYVYYSVPNIIEVPSRLSEDMKYRIMDENKPTGDIINRDLSVFDSYAEASKFRMQRQQDNRYVDYEPLI